MSRCKSPLTAIQAFAKAEYIAQIPGMEWILTAGGGSVSHFVNGYLPVAALLALTMILPIIFEFLANNYERRKRLSDVQNSMLGRYFYFQVLNLYISVTAPSSPGLTTPTPPSPSPASSTPSARKAWRQITPSQVRVLAHYPERD